MFLYFCTNCQKHFTTQSAPLPVASTARFVLIDPAPTPGKSNVLMESEARIAQVCPTSNRSHYVVYVGPVTQEQADMILARPRLSNRALREGAHGLRMAEPPPPPGPPPPSAGDILLDARARLKHVEPTQTNAMASLAAAIDQATDFDTPENVAPQTFLSDDAAVRHLLKKEKIDATLVSKDEMLLLLKQVGQLRTDVERQCYVPAYDRPTDTDKKRAQREVQAFNSRRGELKRLLSDIAGNIKTRSEIEKQKIIRQQQEAAAAQFQQAVAASIQTLTFAPGITRRPGTNLGSDFQWYRGRWRSFAVPCEVDIVNVATNKSVRVQFNQGLMVKHLLEYLYRFDNGALLPTNGATQAHAIAYVNAFGTGIRTLARNALRASKDTGDYVYSADGAWDYLFKKDGNDIVCYHVLCRRRNNGAFWGVEKGGWQPVA